MASQIFSTQLIQNEGTYLLEIPADRVEASPSELLSKWNIKINELPFSVRVKRQNTNFQILLTYAIVRKLELKKDDEVKLEISYDSGKSIIVPDSLKQMLIENVKAKEVFDQLPIKMQKNYISWINSARKSETKELRLASTLESLLGRNHE